VDVFQDIVKSAVEKVLPDMLRAQLPSLLQDLLPGMLAGPSPSVSLSPTPRSSQIANAPTQHRLTPSHKPTPAAVFKSIISTHTKTHLQKFLTDALDRACDQVSELHNSAEIEFDETRVEARFDFETLKEDLYAAFNDDCNERLAQFKELLEEAEVEVEAHADTVVLKAWDRVNVVGNEVWCSCKCRHGAKQRRRAVSVPF
jgi:hypothetical protein